MQKRETRNTGGRALLTVASIVVVIAGLRAASDLLVPLVVALFLAMISLPLMHGLERLRVPRAAAAVLSVLIELGVLTGIGFVMGGSFRGFVEAAPRYQARLRVLADRSLDWLAAHGVDVSRELAFEVVNPGVAFDLASGALRGLAGALSQIVIVALVILFALLEITVFEDKLQAAFGSRSSVQRFEKIRTDVLRYLGIKTVISLVTGSIVGVSLALLGIDFPIVWGVLAFVLNFIPSLGSILAAIPPMLLALVQYGLGRALVVALVFLAVNVLLGNFVEPRLMGRRLGLSTLVVFLSLIIWGWIWGPVGMLLSVPLTMILKIMLENTPDLRWISVVLGDRPPDSAASADV